MDWQVLRPAVQIMYMWVRTAGKSWDHHYYAAICIEAMFPFALNDKNFLETHDAERIENSDDKIGKKVC